MLFRSGNDINGYVTPRVSYTGQEENAEFFGLIGGHLEGGTTIQAALQSINNPNFKLDYEYNYSMYEIETYDDRKKISDRVRDMFLGRGVVHEWIHQILCNNISEAIGIGHTHSRDMPYRYDGVPKEKLSKYNMMMDGGAWDANDYPNPKITDNLFTILEKDLYWVNEAIGGKSVPKETVSMEKLRFTKALKK